MLSFAMLQNLVAHRMTYVTIMTGADFRRKWRRAEREQILAAAFAPGAVVAHVARQFDVASSLIYTWRWQATGVTARKRASFSPAVLIEQAQGQEAGLPPLLSLRQALSRSSRLPSLWSFPAVCG
jgi:transposase